MSAITGADVVVKTLLAAGVEHVFGIVSIHNMPIVDAINRHDGIVMIDARNEQSATHMADGYARATGKLGVALASTGPGTTNTVTGLYEAQYASSKVLVVTGQAETGFYGRGKGYVHEAENQLPMLQTVARKVGSPRYIDDVGPTLADVIDDINSARPQPGAIEIPIDLQTALTEAPLPTLRTPVRLAPDPAALAAAVDQLRNAKRRVILAGGGVIASDAGEALQRLAEALDAPVITTTNGKGALPDDHPLLMGAVMQGPAIAKALGDAEVMLAVGTRFQAGVAGNALRAPMPPMVHIDADPRTIGLNYPVDVGLVADAQVTLNKLADELAGEGGDAQYRETVEAAAGQSKQFMLDRIGPDHKAIMDSIRQHLPRSGAFVRDNTIPGYFWGNTLMPIYSQRSHMHPTSGAIGPGLPLGIGAAIGRGEKTVCVHGDGGFMFHVGELATAAQYRVPLVIVIYNDRGYGILRGIQAQSFEGRFHETELFTPNFVQMAESMGVKGYRAESAAEFDDCMGRAMQDEGPVLIEIEVPNLVPIEGILPTPSA